MLDLAPVSVADGTQVVPREVLLAAITPRLQPQPGDTDVCVMWCTVDGVKDGKPTRFNYHLWDEADTEHDISSMARVTGFSAAIGALFMGRGRIPQQGIVAPEECFPGPNYPDFLAELRKRDIVVLETEEQL